MSLSAIRRKTHEAANGKSDDFSSKCNAIGCPCMGTLGEGEKFFCAHHFFNPADQWPRITESLREFSWLIEFHDELQKMERKGQDWRSFAMRFWENDDEAALLQPNPKENAFPYMNRMRGELGYRCGINKRAGPRLPQEIKGRRGLMVNGEPMRKAA